MHIRQPIQGQRICLRNCQASDIEFLSRMWLDAENGKYTSDPTPEYADEAFQKALQTLPDSPFGYYLVVQRTDTKQPVGSVSLFPDTDKKVYEIGYCIHKDHWRKGYATEAVELAIDWLRKTGAEKLTAQVANENAASRALLCKLGFRVAGQSSFQKYNMPVRFESLLYARRL
ncbi:GNAT family N-acetyltransferase [uncultured Ruthenibacterium sp.]|uniref:GNAT family N-acetyltransferase n=1 Tax=uncultured Ruthenibacterium sp. TaxID=1905347 RepID=UPI00349E89B8